MTPRLQPNELRVTGDHLVFTLIMQILWMSCWYAIEIKKAVQASFPFAIYA